MSAGPHVGKPGIQLAGEGTRPVAGPSRKSLSLSLSRTPGQLVNGVSGDGHETYQLAMGLVKEWGLALELRLEWG
jgi:hypothetical protein